MLKYPIYSHTERQRKIQANVSSDGATPLKSVLPKSRIFLKKSHTYEWKSMEISAYWKPPKQIKKHADGKKINK